VSCCKNLLSPPKLAGDPDGVSWRFRAILERTQLASIMWNWEIVLWMLLFAACLFSMYSIVPYYLRKAGATAMNLSLLTSDFYGLLFGIVLFGFQVPFFSPLCCVTFPFTNVISFPTLSSPGSMSWPSSLFWLVLPSTSCSRLTRWTSRG